METKNDNDINWEKFQNYGENQVVTVLTLNWTTSKEFDRGFIIIEIIDQIDFIVEKYMGTQGNLAHALYSREYDWNFYYFNHYIASRFL